ncbi:DUF1552 domain-containing protein [Calycomorphotria hydatis]|uniref:Secreted protein containing DUF1552 n=1 Tax=Calycomorphotria hydatis TaxID=2528027 RepID=A0A517TDY2_9PLAN|nr:DUF1552 domain-containing protein [Calycomorphotria hydatis]QDT66572.1 hypothetical protein V22_38420 [Calycomorphotria hydatis]
MFPTFNVDFRKQLHRRTVLRGAGISIALPWLSAMQPTFAARTASEQPHRFVAMTLGLGLLPDNLNPEQTGKDYAPSRYLESLQDIRDRFTVISGSSHPGVTGGHRAEASILTANPAGSSGRAKNTISIDQLIARERGHLTRFPSLVLSSNGSSSPSYTEGGAMIPANSSPARLFTELFIEDSPAERERQTGRVQQGRSIMDLVQDDAKRLNRELGTGDRDRLDAYFTSIRDLEKRLALEESWSHKPKPKVDVPKPVDIRNSANFIGQQRLMCDMIKLALKTDSSRIVSYHLGGTGGVVPLEGVEEGYHGLSHHGKDEIKLDQLAIVETEIVRAWGDFLRDLASHEDEHGNLLDQTSVLMTSNLGNSSNHDNRNMPVLFAGGQFKHAGHLAFDKRHNYPLPNLYVSLLQSQGFEVDAFRTSTGTMNGLEVV